MFAFFEVFNSNFLHDFCTLLHWNPWHIWFLNFCICIPHKFWIWTSTLRVFWGGIGSQLDLEASACMNLDDFHVQMHLGPHLGLHRPSFVGIQVFLDHMAVIQECCKSSSILAPTPADHHAWPSMGWLPPIKAKEYGPSLAAPNRAASDCPRDPPPSFLFALVLASGS